MPASPSTSVCIRSPASAAFASGVQLLLVASVCFAVVTVVPQILIPLATAMVAPALNDLVSTPGDLDPVRYTALHVADDLAYGAGLWRGCLHARTLRPLIPHVVLRARVWSPSSLRSQLGRDPAQCRPNAIHRLLALEGTNVAQGKEILAKSGLAIISANDLADAAQKIVAAVKGR